MAGLDMIRSYLSESEDSDTQDDSKINRDKISSSPKNLLQRFSVPESILSLKGTKHHEDVHDDPSQHDGRTRTFKHERGNWATLVYINYPDYSPICSWLRELPQQIGIKEVLNFFTEFHLSLTRCLVLKFHWIESFVDSLQKLCQSTGEILVEFRDLKVYCNEERTRTFLGLRCEDRNKILKQFVINIDKILAEYQLPSFYEDASFHVSILWCLGDVKEKLNASLPALNESWNSICAEHFLHSFEVSKINCKIGNKMYTFPLK
ncbi:U6 snRNA phosphodiesterase [Neodiprion lecontei]|uniref:U6 snRNA phosphodiesterase n=1 Tax=Neodiprion lecontei TaxID=441921 RepID=A0A6J0BWZ5_NEOLC|nr:U6 snRNA phosphodiesterase [Neodiprion lecontei]XP_015518767.1 U6 snRNA phosphodiesterase [Neodiprion lecontei]